MGGHGGLIGWTARIVSRWQLADGRRSLRSRENVRKWYRMTWQPSDLARKIDGEDLKSENSNRKRDLGCDWTIWLEEGILPLKPFEHEFNSSCVGISC